MKDDFCALDLLSIDGFRLSPLMPDPGKKKKKNKKAKKAKKKAQRIALELARKPGPVIPARRRLASLLPLLGRRFGRHDLAHRGLKGWPVALSWSAPEPVKAVNASDPESPWGNF